MSSRKVEGIVILLGFLLWSVVGGVHIVAWAFFGQPPTASAFTIVGLEVCLAMAFAALGIKWLGMPDLGWTLMRHGIIKRWLIAGTYFCEECKGEGDAPASIRHVDGCAVARTLRALGSIAEKA